MRPFIIQAVGLIAVLDLVGSSSESWARSQPGLASWEVGVAFGYDTNLLNSSDAERQAFDSGDPGAFFVVDRLEDAFLHGRAEAEWNLGQALGARSSLRGRYERLQFVHESIKDENRYALGWAGRIGRTTRVGIDGSFLPQVYERHRRDKDALPGDPLFRAEVYRRWDVAAEWLRSWTPRFAAGLEVSGSWRNYGEAFQERDRRRLGLAALSSWEASPRLRFELEGGYRRSRSRNEPDLGSDLSYREWTLRPGLRAREVAGISEARLLFERNWRHYTSDDPDDEDHFGRDDAIAEIRAGVVRQLYARLSATASFARSWREAKSALGTVSLD